VDKVAERFNVRLIDLNKDEFVEVTPPNPLSLKKVKVAKTALNSTIISVPKSPNLVMGAAKSKAIILWKDIG
jgi:hypothetical protein